MKNIAGYCLGAAIATLSLMTGCASIVDGSSQVISVETRKDADSVAGASCTLTSNKGTWFVTTPGTVTVHRGYDDLNVKCTKPDFLPGIATVKSSTKGMAFGNLLFGGIIGAAIDTGTGAAYDYPTLITVQMVANSVIAPPPSVESAAPTQVSSLTRVSNVGANGMSCVKDAFGATICKKINK